MLIQMIMLRTYRVDGIIRRTGDTIQVRKSTAERLLEIGAAQLTPQQTEERRAARPVSPNRMKFASEVKALDPHAEDYYQRVTTLQAEYDKRDGLIRELVRAYTHGPVEDRVFILLGPSHEPASLLDDAIRAAIERFVVDRY